LNVAALLGKLVRRDIRLSAEGGQLRLNAPRGALTPELREALRARKAEILEFLREAERISSLPPAIVPLQPLGARPPVFGIGGHNGDVHAFRDLVRRLGEDQPFFGLWPPGLDGRSEPLERIEQLGAYFAGQIRAFRPHGPCVIAGYCGGGAGAYELARQLERSGAEVRLVALFGCPHPSLYRLHRPRLPYWGKRVVMHGRVLAALPSLEERRRYLAERIRGRVEQLRRERGIKHKYEKVTLAAVKRYTPGELAARLCLFIPHRQWLSGSDAALRWRSAAPRTEVYHGPDSVDPERMLAEPHAAAFAELFRSCLA
jgi:thioesterase domain-containing protein